MKQFLWEQQIVSISDNTVTFKWGKQVELTPQVIRHCVTDEKKTPEELLELRHAAFQTYVLEAADSLGLNEKEMLQGIDLTLNTWRRQKAEAVMIAFWKTPKEAQFLSSDPNWFFNFNYQDIKKFL